MRLRIHGLTITSARVAAGPNLHDAALTAAVELPPGEIPWSGLLVVEGIETGDERIIEADALTWADLPLPLTDNHDRDRLLGRVDTITRDGTTIRGTGVFDDSDAGREAARQVAAQLRRGLSVDLDDLDGEIVIETVTGPEGEPLDPDDAPPPEVVIPIGGDLFRVTAARIRGVALATIAAFVEAQIQLDVEVAQTPDAGAPPAVAAAASSCGCGVTASCSCPPESGRRVVRDPALVAAIQPPVRPPAAWFADPDLSEPTAIVVEPSGRVFGHLAGGDCHLSFTDRCVRVSGDTSRDFSSFNDGPLETEEGDDVLVGQITLTGGHADVRLSARDAVAHYDDTRSAVADITVGWDARHDLPWFAGALRPGVTEEQVRVLRASGVSGDWRPIRGERRLVAALSVNTPGWPVWRTRARVASGEITTVVASGLVAARGETDDPERVWRADVMRRLAVLEGAYGPLAGVGRDALASRLRPGGTG